MTERTQAEQRQRETIHFVAGWLAVIAVLTAGFYCLLVVTCPPTNAAELPVLPTITLARRVSTSAGRPNFLLDIRGGQPGDVIESQPRTGTIPLRVTPLDSGSCVCNFWGGEKSICFCDVPVDTISLWDHRMKRGDVVYGWTYEVNIGCEYIDMPPIPGQSWVYDCPCGIFKSPTGCDDAERGVVPPPGMDMDSLARAHFLHHFDEQLDTTNLDPKRNSAR